MRKKTERPKKPSLLTYNLSLPYSQQPVFIRLVRRFLEHDLGRGAASLSYYMLFSLFPRADPRDDAARCVRSAPVYDGPFARLYPAGSAQCSAHVYERPAAYRRQPQQHVVSRRQPAFADLFCMRTMNCLLRSLRTAYGYRWTARCSKTS